MWKPTVKPRVHYEIADNKTKTSTIERRKITEKGSWEARNDTIAKIQCLSRLKWTNW